VQAGRGALVHAVVDAAVGGVAALGAGGTERAAIAAGQADDAAVRVPWAATAEGSLVEAVHRLDREVVGKVAGVGHRPVVAAGTRPALAGGIGAELGRIPVVVVGGGVRLGLVGEREEFQQVVVAELPVDLAA